MPTFMQVTGQKLNDDLPLQRKYHMYKVVKAFNKKFLHDC